MGADTTLMEAAVLVGSLVDNIIDSFGSATDLYWRLKRRLHKDEDRKKSRRRRSFHEYEDDRRSYRSKDGGPRRSLNDFTRSESSEEDSLNISGNLVRLEYDRGYRELGYKFSTGDLIAQTQLQAQIIGIQATLLSIYEMTTLPNPPPIPHHLSRLLASVQKARTGSISALSQQYERMIAATPLSVQRTLPAPPAAISAPPRSRGSELTIARSATSSRERHNQRHRLFCPYALDLQDHLMDPLAGSFDTGGDNRCPHCSCVVPLTEGKSWEIVKEDPDGGPDRVFHIENRFVVKSHRSGKGFACVLCSRERPSDTVASSTKALIEHVWLDHTIDEYERDIDVKELLFREVTMEP